MAAPARRRLTPRPSPYGRAAARAGFPTSSATRARGGNARGAPPLCLRRPGSLLSWTSRRRSEAVSACRCPRTCRTCARCAVESDGAPAQVCTTAYKGIASSSTCCQSLCSVGRASGAVYKAQRTRRCQRVIRRPSACSSATLSRAKRRTSPNTARAPDPSQGFRVVGGRRRSGVLHRGLGRRSLFPGEVSRTNALPTWACATGRGRVS